MGERGTPQEQLKKDSDISKGVWTRKHEREEPGAPQGDRRTWVVRLAVQKWKAKQDSGGVDTDANLAVTGPSLSHVGPLQAIGDALAGAIPFGDDEPALPGVENMDWSPDTPLVVSHGDPKAWGGTAGDEGGGDAGWFPGPLLLDDPPLSEDHSAKATVLANPQPILAGTDLQGMDDLGSPLTLVDTPGVGLVELPGEGKTLPIVPPDTKDFTVYVHGWELSKDAPVIKWPGGYKTVVPFIPSKKNPKENFLKVVRHDVYGFFSCDTYQEPRMKMLFNDSPGKRQRSPRPLSRYLTRRDSRTSNLWRRKCAGNWGMKIQS